MKGLIEYNHRSNKTLGNALKEIQNAKKLNYGTMTYVDLQIGNIPKLTITKEWESEVFGFGIYVFFHNNKPVYVGKADSNFKHRFQSHRHFDGRPEYAFNKLARKIAEIQLGDENLAMNKPDFYEIVLPEMDKLNLVRINFKNNLIEKNKCSRLENLLRKGFAETIYNPIKNVRGYNAEEKIKNLML